MKCFTLKAKKDDIVLSSYEHAMTTVESEPYPSPAEGIIVAKGQADVEIAPGLRAELSPALLAGCKPVPGHPDQLLIERVSLGRLPNGTLVLNEDDGSEPNSALVLLDIGRGTYSSVRYEVGNRVLLRARRPSDGQFGSEELALVEVPVGRPFTAYRSNRRWYCFGIDVVGERVQIRYDGRKLTCEPAKDASV
jgi:hypothetical protein